MALRGPSAEFVSEITSCIRWRPMERDMVADMQFWTTEKSAVQSSEDCRPDQHIGPGLKDSLADSTTHLGYLLPLPADNKQVMSGRRAWLEHDHRLLVLQLQLTLGLRCLRGVPRWCEKQHRSMILAELVKRRHYLVGKQTRDALWK